MQSRAFLLVIPKTNKNIVVIGINKIAIALQEKWKGILINNLSSSITKNERFDFQLINRGKSDIVEWSIDITAVIVEGEYLNKKFGINGETSKWIINSKPTQTIAPNQSIEIPAILIGDFPNVVFNWEIKYKDLMDGEYSTNNNPNGFSHSNLIALNHKI